MQDIRIRRDPAGIFELLKMISGLVAVVALLAVVLGYAMFERAEGQQSSASSGSANAATPSEAAKPAIQTPPITYTRSQNILQDTPRIVFYLVVDEEQENYATWIEGTGELEATTANYDLPPRTNYVLQVETPEKEQSAMQTIYETMTANKRLALVEVVDMRTVAPPNH
jgi:hypothetical protein